MTSDRPTNVRQHVGALTRRHRALTVFAAIAAIGLATMPLAAADAKPSATTASKSTSKSGKGKSAKPAAAKRKDANGLTGWGASRTIWDANYREASGYVDGMAYLPLVTSLDDARVPMYTEVTDNHLGKIGSFSINAPYGTTLAEAKAIATRELGGADLGQGFKQGENAKRCTFFVVDDAKLKKALGGVPVVIVYTYEVLPVDVVYGKLPSGVESINFLAVSSRAALRGWGC